MNKLFIKLNQFMVELKKIMIELINKIRNKNYLDQKLIFFAQNLS